MTDEEALAELAALDEMRALDAMRSRVPRQSKQGTDAAHLAPRPRDTGDYDAIDAAFAGLTDTKWTEDIAGGASAAFSLANKPIAGVANRARTASAAIGQDRDIARTESPLAYGAGQLLQGGALFRGAKAAAGAVGLPAMASKAAGGVAAAASRIPGAQWAMSRLAELASQYPRIAAQLGAPSIARNAPAAIESIPANAIAGGASAALQGASPSDVATAAGESAVIGPLLDIGVGTATSPLPNLVKEYLAKRGANADIERVSTVSGPNAHITEGPVFQSIAKQLPGSRGQGRPATDAQISMAAQHLRDIGAAGPFATPRSILGKLDENIDVTGEGIGAYRQEMETAGAKIDMGAVLSELKAEADRMRATGAGEAIITAPQIESLIQTMEAAQTGRGMATPTEIADKIASFNKAKMDFGANASGQPSAFAAAVRALRGGYASAAEQSLGSESLAGLRGMQRQYNISSALEGPAQKASMRQTKTGGITPGPLTFAASEGKAWPLALATAAKGISAYKPAMRASFSEFAKATAPKVPGAGPASAGSLGQPSGALVPNIDEMRREAKRMYLQSLGLPEYEIQMRLEQEEAP